MTDIAPILGLTVYLWRSKDRECPCKKNLMQAAILGEGNGPHAASARCRRCNRHYVWLPAQAVTFWLDTVRLFGPLDYVVLQDATTDDAAATGEAIAVSSDGTQHGMGRLGFKYGGENIIPFVKYDARSGQFSRNDRVEKNGKFENSLEEITFKATVDLESFEVGYINFIDGQAPEYALVPAGAEMPANPDKTAGWKQGVRFMLKLDKSCGGDVRELTSTAQAFLHGFEDLLDVYDREKAQHPGKLPLVAVNKTTPKTTGKSTNRQPVFEIIGWVDRPTDLVFVPKGDDAPF